MSGAGKSTLLRCLSTSRKAHLGRDHPRRGRPGHPHGQAAHRHPPQDGGRLPGLQPAHAAHRAPERGLPARARARRQGRGERPRRRAARAGGPLGKRRRATPPSSRAGRSSGWRSPARWPPAPRCCSATSRTSALDSLTTKNILELLHRHQPEARTSRSSSSPTRSRWSRRSATRSRSSTPPSSSSGATTAEIFKNPQERHDQAPAGIRGDEEMIELLQKYGPLLWENT